MKVTLLITIQVKNFSEWITAFNTDTAKAVREQAGITVLGVYQSVENENTVTVMEESASEESAKTFVAGLKAVMEKSGVTTVPEIKILKKA